VDPRDEDGKVDPVKADDYDAWDSLVWLALRQPAR
jgi:hypothetical protein